MHIEIKDNNLFQSFEQARKKLGISTFKTAIQLAMFNFIKDSEKMERERNSEESTTL